MLFLVLGLGGLEMYVFWETEPRKRGTSGPIERPLAVEVWSARPDPHAWHPCNLVQESVSELKLFGALLLRFRAHRVRL